MSPGVDSKVKLTVLSGTTNDQPLKAVLDRQDDAEGYRFLKM